jgi:xylulokinase
VQWFYDHVARSTPEELDAEAADLPPGAERLLCLPNLVGERVPGWNPAARGGFFGLTSAHRRGHLHRAILEGSAFAARHVFDLLEKQGARLDVVHLADGGGIE